MVPENEIRCFRRRLRVVERAVMSNLKEESSCCGVSLTQCHLLLELEEHTTAPVPDLISYVGLDKSTVSRTIDGLVTLGLVHRRENPKDRRSQLVELSPQGRAAVARINKLCNGKYQALLGRLTAAERKKVLWGMERIAELLQEDQKNGEGSCFGR
jgi:DNA-binding MarR family transcriptional regulator